METHEQEELIVSNMSLVRHIASKYYTNRIGMEYEDLVSYGVMGLIDASTKFDKNRGVKFSTFASIRISSYIIDEIRRHSPISRTYTSKIKEYNKCVENLQNTYYRQPSLEEVSKCMDISIKEANDIKLKMMSRSNVSLDGVIYEDESEVKLIDTIKEKEEQSPSYIIEKQELQEVMEKAIDNLKEKDKLVLSLYYYEDMTLKEIGLVLGVSESRVSQLNTRAISNLRAEMKRIKYID